MGQPARALVIHVPYRCHSYVCIGISSAIDRYRIFRHPVVGISVLLSLVLRLHHSSGKEEQDDSQTFQLRGMIC